MELSVKLLPARENKSRMGGGEGGQGLVSHTVGGVGRFIDDRQKYGLYKNLAIIKNIQHDALNIHSYAPLDESSIGRMLNATFFLY